MNGFDYFIQIGSLIAPCVFCKIIGYNIIKAAANIEIVGLIVIKTT